MAQGVPLSRLIAVASLLAPLVSGCSGGSDLPKLGDFSVSKTFGVFSNDAAPDGLSVAPAAASDLVAADGTCQGGGAADAATAGPDAAAAPPPPGIGLMMTECQLVAAAGPPDNVEIGAGQSGERTAALTYLKGERAGIYRFVEGRLKVIDGVPAPAKPTPKKPVRKRKRA